MNNFIGQSRFLYITILAIISFLFIQCSKTVDEHLKEIAEAANKQCPRTVDEWTRLDSCVALPNKHYRFYHTISQPIIDTLLFKSNFKPIIIDKIIKVDPTMYFFKENGVTIEYQYNNTEKGYICEIIITPEEYK